MDSKLSFYHINICSLVNKIDEIALETEDFDIIGITETHLDNSVKNDEIVIPNYYEPIRRDRNRYGGGVAIYIRKNISYKRRQDLESKEIESLCIEIHKQPTKTICTIAYKPPNQPVDSWKKVQDFFENLNSLPLTRHIILGDFNNNILIKNPTPKITTIMKQLNLFQHIKEPTRKTDTTATTIDLIITNFNDNIISSGTFPQHLSDHSGTFLQINWKQTTQQPTKFKLWKYSEGNYDEIRNKLKSEKWDDIFDNETNINNIYDKITEKITNLANRYIPNKTVITNSKNKPWFSKELKKLKKEVLRKRNKAVKTNKHNDWKNYRDARNTLTTKIRKAKLEYPAKVAEELKQNTNSKSAWWKTTNTLLYGSKYEIIPPLENVNGKPASNPLEKAEILNNQFVKQTILNEIDRPTPYIQRKNKNTLDKIEINQQEICDALKSLDRSKAPGPDEIHPYLLRECYKELTYPIYRLVKYSLQIEEVPTSWKRANVKPIYKSGERSEPVNYRPISLTSCICKIAEKIIFKKLYNFFKENNVISTNQSGFTPGDSATNQITELYNNICLELDNSNEVRAVFLDMSKAFDKVWHRGLLSKLASQGIRGKLLHWIKNYLSDRYQRVIVDNTSSSWASIHAGVPQGSILGPLLFLIFINDLTENVVSNIRLFADDSMIFLPVEDPTQAANLINEDLIRIHKWSEKWLVTFNAGKTKSMIFSRKNKPPNHPDLFFNNVKVTKVPTHKHLGITFKSDGKWDVHINNIITKANKKLVLLRKLKYLLDRKSLQNLYFAHIRPILEYGNTIWCNCTEELSDQIEEVQLEAARIVTGAVKGTHHSHLYKETKWNTLKKRRETNQIVLFRKMLNKEVPPYLYLLIPPPRETQYNTRAETRTITPLYAKRELYFNSFLPKTIRIWNSLNYQTRNILSISLLKNKLNGNTKTPKYYNTGNRTSQIWHARIRMECSNLNKHMYLRYLSDNKGCQCGHTIEDENHYFFHCPLYNNQRTTYIPPNSTLDEILYGNSEWNETKNAELFERVCNFIIQTKRFI